MPSIEAKPKNSEKVENCEIKNGNKSRTTYDTVVVFHLLSCVWLCVTPWTAACHMLPCHSPSPGACSNSCPLRQWCHPTISFSVPFPSRLQYFPPSGSFLMSPLFTSVTQSVTQSHITHISQSVQSLSHVWLFATPWTAACQASLSITNSWRLLKLMSIALVMPSKHLILCPLVLLLSSIFPSVSHNESVPHIRWPKYWNSSINLYNEYSGLISFKIDWLDLLAPRDSQESSPTPQFKSINSLVLSLFYMVQLSHPYMTTGKTIWHRYWN